jgi:uncharacterized protein (DUF2062 family)
VQKIVNRRAFVVVPQNVPRPIVVMRKIFCLMAAPAAFAQALALGLIAGLFAFFHYGNALAGLGVGAGTLVLIQTGYFAGILFLVWREHRGE